MDSSDDTELGYEVRAGVAGSSPHGRLLELLQKLAEANGSDLFLVVGSPPTLRALGTLHAIGSEALNSSEIHSLVYPVLPPHARRAFETQGAANCSLRVAELGRFRINFHRERGQFAATLRMLPRAIPTLRELNLPDELEELTRLSPGLVLIGGATGSGKTTTMASLIDAINQGVRRHIIND
jgi:Tfp pilus assembly pilus retraction ATPase PilT